VRLASQIEGGAKPYVALRGASLSSFAAAIGRLPSVTA